MGKLFIGDAEPSSLGALDKLYIGDELVWPTAVANVEGVVKVSHSTGAGGATGSIAFPDGAQAGMALVFINRALNSDVTGTPPAKVLPPGYTDLNQYFAVETFETVRICASYKILTQADVDAATPLTGMGGNSNNQRLALLFKGVDSGGALVPLTQVWPERFLVQIGNAAVGVQMQDINGTWQNPKGINIGIYSSSGAVSPRNWVGSQQFDEEIPIGNLFYCKYMVNGANANPLDVSMDDEGNRNTILGLLLGFQ